MVYAEALENIRKQYPFAGWKAKFFPGAEDENSSGQQQYSEDNCNKVIKVFDKLINDLCLAGENAPESDKVVFFKLAVESLNKIAEEINGLIETGEREDLCELIDNITIAAKLNPEDYADGEGIADEWRNW